MKISSNTLHVEAQKNSKIIKNSYSEKISSDEVSEIKSQIAKNAQEMMQKSISTQSSVASSGDKFAQNQQDFKDFLSSIGYDGKPIAELSQAEASELISEDGFFGIKETSNRIANFIIDRADGDEDMLRAGRAGMLEGFKMAEEMWGEELPQISKDTMQKATEIVDSAMSELGFSVLNIEA